MTDQPMDRMLDMLERGQGEFAEVKISIEVMRKDLENLEQATTRIAHRVEGNGTPGALRRLDEVERDIVSLRERLRTVEVGLERRAEQTAQGWRRVQDKAWEIVKPVIVLAVIGLVTWSATVMWSGFRDEVRADDRQPDTRPAGSVDPGVSPP